jgi:uncharacterized protein (DUF362 family)/Pyruvate/2-oxoacid:ferredoxin oxidoreductase delta subunit
MDRSTVALVRCDGYDPDTVFAALERGLDLLGGLDRFVRPGERILLKPNILAGDGPEKAVTTHPAVLAGCVRLFRAGGAMVSFGDSPGLDSTAHAARGSGLEEAGVRSGAQLGDFSSGGSLANPGGRLVSSFPAAQAVHQCDGLVNLPKLKTHQLTRITGAVKNLYGCIPGKRKALYHVQFQDILDFCGLLAEINLRLRPRLHVMDAIVAMEGNGPRSGDPRPLNVLILSTDPVAVDATCCRLVDLDPAYVPTTVVGRQLGLGHDQAEFIEYVGDPLEAFVQPGFRLVRKPVYRNASYAYYNTIKSLVLPRPAIDEARCIRCGICVSACPLPEKALGFRNGNREHPPVYRYDRCIRCYCCHEMCPQRAIEKKTPLLGKVLRLG